MRFPKVVNVGSSKTLTFKLNAERAQAVAQVNAASSKTLTCRLSAVPQLVVAVGSAASFVITINKLCVGR
jgi:hypothetical protein